MEEEKKSGVFEMPDGRRLDVPKEDLEYIFKGYRPRLMSAEDFRVISKILKKEVKRYRGGRIIHLSKVSDSVWDNYIKDQKIKPRQKGHTYVKKDEETR
jgi:hypothetical protein